MFPGIMRNMGLAFTWHHCGRQLDFDTCGFRVVVLAMQWHMSLNCFASYLQIAEDTFSKMPRAHMCQIELHPADRIFSQHPPWHFTTAQNWGHRQVQVASPLKVGYAGNVLASSI